MSKTATIFTEQELVNIKKAKGICRAIDHPLRAGILDYIHKKGEANVTEIYIHLRIEQSVASQHLAILRDAKVVSTKRFGKEIKYSINSVSIEKYNLSVGAMVA